MQYRIEEEGYSLFADYAEGLIMYCSPDGGKWKMKLAPYVLFSDGRKVMFPPPAETVAREAEASDDVYAMYQGFEGSDIRAYTRISAEKISGDLRFEMRIEGDQPGEIAFAAYPSPWEAQDGSGLFTVLPRMQGELVLPGSALTVDKGKIYERTAYMPMFGQTAEGHACLAVYDTPCDASYDFALGRVTPLWRPSLGTVRYQRRMLYSFMQGDYNDIALRYRRYVKEKGNLITLKAKAALNPLVERLAGCPVIHTGIAVHISPDSRYYMPDDPEHNDHFVSFDERAGQIRLLKKKGLRKAYTHFDGWGVRGYDNLHPSPLPPSPIAGGQEGMRRLMDAVRECGYLFGIHDQYRDYYFDAPHFTLDEARQNLDGSHSHNHIWYGGHYAYLCAEKAVEYVKRNYTLLERMGIVPDSSYLDVFSLAELDECFNPKHRMSRAQSVMRRRECLDWLTSRGISPSSEETLDCILPSQVLCHHAPFNSDDLAGGDVKPIPLFNLVYHDCVVIPWIGLKGETGSSGLPAPMSTYLYAIMNAGPVYCPIDADEDTIASVQEACAVQEKLMYTPMRRHEFLDASGLKQRITYADGTSIEADMEKGTYRVFRGEAQA